MKNEDLQKAAYYLSKHIEASLKEAKEKQPIPITIILSNWQDLYETFEQRSDDLLTSIHQQISNASILKIGASYDVEYKDDKYAIFVLDEYRAYKDMRYAAFTFLTTAS